MKKVSYLLILLFIFTLSLHKASAADVWLGFDEAWATTPEVRMYNLGNMNKPSKCAVGKFVVGISWFQSPEGLENESVHVDCISALDNYTYRPEYNFQQIQEWQESEPIYSEIDPSFQSPDYEYCVYKFPGEEVPTLNMIDSILEFIGLKKTYAIEQPVEGEQGGHWLCYKTVTVTRDVAQETTVSTQNNPVAFAYTIPPLLPIYNYNAYNDNYGYQGFGGRFGYNLKDVMDDTINKYKNNDMLYPSNKGSGGGGNTSYYEATCPDGEVAVGANMGGGLNFRDGGMWHSDWYAITTNNYISLSCRKITGAKLKPNSGSWWILPTGTATVCTSFLGIRTGCDNVDYTSAAVTGEKRVFCPLDKVLVGIRFFNSPERIDDEHIAIYCKSLESLPPDGYEPDPPPNPTSTIPSIFIR